jgi:signal recognition particle subunit SRP54
VCLCRDSSGAEQKPEELCVGGSIPSLGTIKLMLRALFLFEHVLPNLLGFAVFSFLSEKIASIVSVFGSKKTITKQDVESFVAGVKSTLIDADVSLTVVNRFTQSLLLDLQEIKVPSGLSLGDVLTQKLYTRVVDFLGGKREKGQIFNSVCQAQGMVKIMVLGLQGSGKTTTAAKLAAWIADVAASSGKKLTVALGSVDTCRPAAREQLALMAQRAGVQFCAGEPGSVEHMIDSQLKQATGCDVFVLDTAGRMQVDAALMQELVATKAAFGPTHTVWVVDGMMGQESVHVGSAFLKEVGFDSVALTKLDSGARGGVAFGVAFELNKPIFFMGTGETVADFEVFEPERVASRIVGLGDVKGLFERFERAIKRDAELDAQAAHDRMMNGTMTLQDFAQQLTLVGSMGSMGKLMQYLPGVPKISAAELEQKEREIKKYKAILSSMTPKERSGASGLNVSRKNRIARGAGVFVKDIDGLLSKFEETKQFARMIKKMGGFGSLFK